MNREPVVDVNVCKLKTWHWETRKKQRVILYSVFGGKKKIALTVPDLPDTTTHKQMWGLKMQKLQTLLCYCVFSNTNHQES